MSEEPGGYETQAGELDALLERSRENERQIAELLSTASGSNQQIADHAKQAKDSAKAASDSSAEAAKAAEIKAKVDAAATASEESKVAANTSADTAASLAKQIEGLLETAKEHHQALADLAEVAEKKEEQVRKYEEELQAFIENYKDINGKIEEALPHATSAGLATAFLARRQELLKRAKSFYWMFIVGIAGLIALGVHALWTGQATTLEALTAYVIQRAPLILVLVLLEEFGRRKYNEIMRVEEDYAFKQSVSHAYIGYRNELINEPGPGIGEDGKPAESLRTTLARNVLDELKLNPGRLIGTQPDHPPGMEWIFKLTDLAKMDSDKRTAQVAQGAVLTIRRLNLWWGLGVFLAVVAGIGVGYLLFGN